MESRLNGIAEAQTLAQAIVNTIHEPFLVLDADICVLAASRSFYETFKVDSEHTRGCSLYSLGDGQWDIPVLRNLLENIIPQKTAMDDFQVDHDFPGLGHRTMLLNARKVIYETSLETTILLAFTDITARRSIEREKELLQRQTDELVLEKQVLLQEMEHRIANSLQIIASILTIKARGVISEEARLHLQDAHQRVMSVAAVQSHLHASEGIDQIAVAPYLKKLCESLASSMIGESQTTKIEVVADGGTIGSGEAVSIGLVVTELVINALKYAFPVGRTDARVIVTYASDALDWKLSVSDNGAGKGSSKTTPTVGGLGTVIIKSLVKQLGARMDIVPARAGYSVAVTRSAVPTSFPKAA